MNREDYPATVDCICGKKARKISVDAIIVSEDRGPNYGCKCGRLAQYQDFLDSLAIQCGDAQIIHNRHVYKDEQVRQRWLASNRI